MTGMLSDLALFVSRSFELSLLAKATVILFGALIAMSLARGARASVRHVVMAASFAALLSLPALVLLMPSVGIAVSITHATAPAAVPAGDPATRATVVAAVGDAARRAWPMFTPLQWIRLAWLGGTIAFLIPVALLLMRLSMIRRTGLPVAWHQDRLARLAGEKGVWRSVELLEHEAVPGPMTFGVSRPVIVLPLDAREWTDAELRRALLHELEHIQRGDWIMQIAARTVAACYWCHPMVWTAWRRLCLEAERACDDAVVTSEERTDYAEQLVLLAQRMSATPAQPLLGMANRSDLSTRVSAVLDERLHRGRAGVALAAGAFVAALLVVGAVAPLRAVAQTGREAVTTSDRGQSSRQAPRKVRAMDRALYEAAIAGDLDEVKELIAAGANVSATIDGDGNALIGAARSGRADIARLLLDQGADPNGVVAGDGSPLINAAQNGRLEQVQLLIAHGADVNLAVDGDENPLMNAAEGGYLDIVQYLVAKGADVQARIYTERYDGAGEWRTALSQARKNGHTTVVKYLESIGARQ